MLILDRIGIRVQVHANESDISYPALAVVNVVLSPAEFFGMEPLSGRLSTAPVGAELRYHGEENGEFRGTGRITATGRNAIMKFTTNFWKSNVEVNGNHVRFTGQANSMKILSEFVANIDAVFPAVMSGAIAAPISIENITGTLQGYDFVVRGNFPSSNPIYIGDPAEIVSQYFEANMPEEGSPCIPLISAFRYLQQCDRLEYCSPHLTTFQAERLINAAKVLEAIFPGDKIDEMRGWLKDMNVPKEYIEIFSSVRYLRNQVDVAHASFRDLPPGDVQSVYEFVNLAIKCLRSLLTTILRDTELQQQVVNRRKNSSAAPKSYDAINYVKRLLKTTPPLSNDITTPDTTKPHRA